MKGLLGQLIQFQELCFAQQEREAAGSKLGLREIQESRERLLGELPREWVRIVERLSGGGQPAVVPATEGFCSFCRIQLPMLMYQEVRKRARIHQCPCCARILFQPDAKAPPPSSHPSRPGRGGLARFSSRSLMIPRLEAGARDGALGELVGALAREGWIAEPESVLQAAVAREELVSTAVEFGLAFPHVRGVEGGGLVMALGARKKGVAFGAPDGRHTRIVFFSVIPQAASSFYLRIMAGLVRIFRQEEARMRLLACEESEPLWEALLDLTQDLVP